MSRAEELAEKVAGNAIITAIARLSIFIACAVGVPFGIWLVGSVVELDKEMVRTQARFTQIEIQRTQSREEIVRRVEAMERHAEAEQRLAREQALRLAELVSTMRSVESAIGRIENRLNQPPGTR